MAEITICSDFGAQKYKVWHCFHCFIRLTLISFSSLETGLLLIFITQYLPCSHTTQEIWGILLLQVSQAQNGEHTSTTICLTSFLFLSQLQHILGFGILHVLNEVDMGLPWQASSWDFQLPLQGDRFVWSLVRELRSHKLCSMAKKSEKKVDSITSSFNIEYYFWPNRQQISRSRDTVKF